MPLMSNFKTVQNSPPLSLRDILKFEPVLSVLVSLWDFFGHFLFLPVKNGMV